MSSNDVKAFQNFSSWTYNLELQEIKTQKRNQIADETEQQVKEDYENGTRSESQYKTNLKEIQNYRTQTEIDYNNFFKKQGEFDATYGGLVDAYDANTMIAKGQIETSDIDGDELLNFNEFLKSELSTTPDAEDFLKEDVDMDDFEKALKNNEELDKFVEEDLLKEFKNVFDSIDYDKNGESDGLLSLDELEIYYDYIDGLDGKVDGKYSASTITGKDAQDTVTITTDYFSKNGTANNDCASRILSNLYGVSYYSEKGQAIWKQIQELNGLKDDTVLAGVELKLPVVDAE